MLFNITVFEMADTAGNVQKSMECSDCSRLYSEPFTSKVSDRCQKCNGSLATPYSEARCLMAEAQPQILVPEIVTEDNIIDEELSQFPEESCDGIPRCDICRSSDKAAIAFCTTCEELMCRECNIAHQGAKATRGHMIQSIDDIVHDLHSQIKAKIQTFEQKQKDLDKIEHEFNCALEAVFIDRDEIFSQIDFQINLMKSKLDDFRTKMREEAMNDMKPVLYIETLTEGIKNIEEIKKKINNRMTTMSYGLKSRDPNSLKDMLDRLYKEIKYPALPPDQRQKYKLECDREFIVSDFLRFSYMRMRPTLPPRPVAQFQDQQRQDLHNPEHLVNRQYIKENLTKEEEEIDFNWLKGANLKLKKKLKNMRNFRLCHSNGHIFITNQSSNEIMVYNESGDEVKTIKHHNISQPCGMCPANDGVIVAAESGLHILYKTDSDFCYGKYLATDAYYDLSNFENQYYALKRRSATVDVFIDEWKIERSIPLIEPVFDIQKVASYNRIFVRQEGFSVQTYSGLYTYNHKGELKEYMKPSADHGFRKGSFVCGIDRHNSLLIADLNTNKLNIIHESGDSTDVALPFNVTRPRDVMVDQLSGVIWIGTYRGACLTLP